MHRHRRKGETLSEFSLSVNCRFRRVYRGRERAFFPKKITPSISLTTIVPITLSFGLVSSTAPTAEETLVFAFYLLRLANGMA